LRSPKPGSVSPRDRTFPRFSWLLSGAFFGGAEPVQAAQRAPEGLGLSRRVPHRRQNLLGKQGLKSLLPQQPAPPRACSPKRLLPGQPAPATACFLCPAASGRRVWEGEHPPLRPGTPSTRAEFHPFRPRKCRRSPRQKPELRRCGRRVFDMGFPHAWLARKYRASRRNIGHRTETPGVAPKATILRGGLGHPVQRGQNGGVLSEGPSLDRRRQRLAIAPNNSHTPVGLPTAPASMGWFARAGLSPGPLVSPGPLELLPWVPPAIESTGARASEGTRGQRAPLARNSAILGRARRRIAPASRPGRLKRRKTATRPQNAMRGR
jgi:hypothetical protein